MAATSQFTGRSGQLALMSEFLIRLLNVAIPEVDVGDDVVVVRDDNDEITRVQVKTANADERRTEGRFYAQFNVPLKQLEAGPPRLVYAFVVRRFDRWEEFIIIRRSVLQRLWIEHDIGSDDGDGNLKLGLTFTADKIVNKGLSMQPFRGRFQPWPPPDEIPPGVLPESAN